MPRSEARAERDIIDFLKVVGFAVWRLSQGYRHDRGGTRQTPGLPDIVAIGHGITLFVEVKGLKGKLRQSQEVFRDECRAHGVPWCMARSPQDVFDYLVQLGILEAV